MANSLSQRKYFFIYKTTNLINGKYYIGMHTTSNLQDGYLGSGKYLRRSVRKHGKENFKCEILEYFENSKELIAREKEIINLELLSDPFCMNLKQGGLGGNLEKNGEHLGGDKWAAAHLYWKIPANLARRSLTNKDIKKRQKASETLKKYYLNRDGTFKNKKHTLETKKKIGAANSVLQKGEMNSQYGTCWIVKEGINKKIKKEEKQNYLNSGWKQGRKVERLR